MLSISEICLILLILVLDRHDSGAVQARREPSHVDRVEDGTRLSSQGNKSINTCKANEGRCSGGFPLPPTLSLTIYSLPVSLTRHRIAKVTFYLAKGYVWKDRQCQAQALPGSENSQHHFQVNLFQPGFRIRIRMFLPCPDPDPHKFADPDPGKKVRK